MPRCPQFEIVPYLQLTHGNPDQTPGLVRLAAVTRGVVTGEVDCNEQR